MKKIYCALAAILMFIGLPAMQAQAADDYFYQESSYVSAEMENSLEEYAQRISNNYDCGVYIAILDSIGGYSSVDALVQDFYEQNNYGRRYDGGVMLLLTMDPGSRQYSIMATGNKGNYSFTDYGKDYLANAFVDYLKVDDFGKGCQMYLETCDNMLYQAANGKPVDIYGKQRSFVGTAAKGFGFALIGSVIYILILLASLKSVHTATTAEKYVDESGVRITMRHDRFSHKTTKREQINNNSSGAGTTVNSRGNSTKSGSF